VLLKIFQKTADGECRCHGVMDAFSQSMLQCLVTLAFWLWSLDTCINKIVLLLLELLKLVICNMIYTAAAVCVIMVIMMMMTELFMRDVSKNS